MKKKNGISSHVVKYISSHAVKSKKNGKTTSSTFSFLRPSFDSTRHHMSFWEEPQIPDTMEWMIQHKVKTVAGIIAICLNIGVNPPDVPERTHLIEAWIDTREVPREQALNQIGKNIVNQYDSWDRRLRLKKCLDTYSEELKKTCVRIRRHCKRQRALFHYNGHGVPYPNEGKEFWVYNKNFTQYIPIPINELRAWIRTPTVYVFDCSHAARLIPENVIEFEEIFLFATSADEELPIHPDVHNDIFTASLTTPIQTAIRWHIATQFSAKSLLGQLSIDKQIEGKINDRRTPLGKLNWIFTSITDSIAWSVLPKDLFQNLFRQDSLLASLFRNYLLAERVMHTYGCTTGTIPAIPSTHRNSLWALWDHALDVFLSGMDDHDFFNYHLQAFRVWLNSYKKEGGHLYLPVILQVILNPPHRLQALTLIDEYVSRGIKNIENTLAVGIFPYIIRQLKNPAPEIRLLVVRIWSKILAYDISRQQQLVRDNGFIYFINVLASPAVEQEQHSLAAMVLAMIMHDFPTGRVECQQSNNLLSLCLSKLDNPDPLTRRNVCLCMAKSWEDYEASKNLSLSENANDKLIPLLNDKVPDVRAAAVYAISMLIDCTPEEIKEHIHLHKQVSNAYKGMDDGSSLVRYELLIATLNMIKAQGQHMAFICQEDEEEFENIQTPKLSRFSSLSSERDFVCKHLWDIILNLSNDPHPKISKLALHSRDEFKSMFIEPPSLSPRVSPPVFTSSSLSKTDEIPRPRKISRRHRNIRFDSPLTSSLGSNSPSDFVHEMSTLSRSHVIPDLSAISIHKHQSHLFEHYVCEILENCDNDYFEQQQIEKLIDKTKITFARKMVQPQDSWQQISQYEGNGFRFMSFHPFQKKIYYGKRRILGEIVNEEIYEYGECKSSYTCIQLINEEYSPLLVSSHDNGFVHVWRDGELASAFNAMPEMGSRIRRRRLVGSIFEFNPRTAEMVVGGDSRSIKVWDTEKELPKCTLPTRIDSFITAITCDYDNVVYAGSEMGQLLVYDMRERPGASLIHELTEHSGVILNVCIQRGGTHSLITGAEDGIVRFWDIRAGRSELSFDTHGMTALSAHIRAPYIAAAHKGKIKIYNHQGTELQVIRIRPRQTESIAKIQWHPYEMSVASVCKTNITVCCTN